MGKRAVLIRMLALAGLAYAATSTMAASQQSDPLAEPKDGASSAQLVSRLTEVRIPAKTIVQIAISEPISSKTAKIGDVFAIELFEPLILDEHTVLPAGLVGRGEVTHAAKSGWGGKAGELIVNARYLECGESRIPLGYFQYMNVGKSNVGGAFAVSQAVPLGQFMVSGGDALIQAGARATAKVKADVVIPAAELQKCAGPAT